MKHKIERINEYSDIRFDKNVLMQHGAFLIDGVKPVSFHITNSDSATVFFEGTIPIEEVIEEFRFYAEHIILFYDKEGKKIKEFPKIKVFSLLIENIQPSQFFVDEQKIEAVHSFLKENEIYIPVSKIQNQYVALDGHTRLFCAMEKKIDTVWGFEVKPGDYIQDFVVEAKKRNIHSPKDLKKLSHEEYREKWNGFCDEFFNGKR